MECILNVHYEGEYRLRILFESGEEGIADLGEVLKKYAAARPLLDYTEFAKYTLDEWPTLVWPCGFDLAPELLYEMVTGKSPSWQQAETVHETREEYKAVKREG
jgi:hypothetical protein